MDLQEGLSVSDKADSVGLLCFGFGAKSLLLETFEYCQTVAVSFCSEAASAEVERDVAVGIVVTSWVETAPHLGLEYPTNLIQAH